MAGAFQMLRSNDLVWSRLVHDYLLGERAPMINLMAWNADATRMPCRMHSQYLRKLFLDNDLAEGRFIAGGAPVTLCDGHNAGIVSELGHDHRGFRIHTKSANDRYLDPERFLKAARNVEGSWWPQWAAWLGEHSGAAASLPPMGMPAQPPLDDAPGTYVSQQ